MANSPGIPPALGPDEVSSTFTKTVILSEGVAYARLESKDPMRASRTRDPEKFF